MLPQTANDVLTALSQHPRGATAKQIAADMNTRQSNVSARLSHLYTFSIIDREKVEKPSNGVEYRYMLKPKTPEHATAMRTRALAQEADALAEAEST